MFDIVLDTLMLPIEREVAADIRKRLSSLSWRPNQIAVGTVRRSEDSEPVKPRILNDRRHSSRWRRQGISPRPYIILL